MNPTFRRPIIRIAVLLGAWCCGFLFYMALGHSLSKGWTECSLGELLISIWEGWRDVLQERLLALNIDKDTYAQIVALTLGNREFLSLEIKTLYREAGASHILALSGMHLGILYGTFRLIIQKLTYTKWKWIAFFITMLILWSYALMTGCPKSLIRASLMTSLALLLQMYGERRRLIDILNVSAATVFLVDPASVFDIGFQLSCAAMLGIIIIGIPTIEKLTHLSFIPRIILSGLTISISAQLATLPLTMFYFQNIALYGSLTSLIAIPLTTLTIYFSIGVYFGIPWCLPIIELLLKCQNLVMKFVSNLPGAYIEL